MNQPRGILLVTHDLSYAFAKTTEYLANACRRMGIHTVVRDCCDLRLTALVLDPEKDDALMRVAEESISSRWNALMEDFQVDCVMSLDLGWLVIPDHLIDHPSIRRIFSIWFDDPWSWCKARTNTIFPYRKRPFQEIITHPKVLHSFYGKGIGAEAYLTGMHNQIPCKLAAPQEFLHRQEPCEITERLAFIGNPGYRGQPHPEALELLEKGAELPALREQSRRDIMLSLRNERWHWSEKHPEIKNIIDLATATKLDCPFDSALQIIQLCGETYPSAFEMLNQTGNILDAAWLVKLVNRYDRPALIHRLYKKGLVDVISNDEEWSVYGVKAAPSIFADEMPKYYRKYAAHLNASNATRDATANEKLFEIAACGRVSINIDSPDIRECYSDQEVCYVNSLSEAEDVARDLIANPDRALTMGKRARRRTAMEHTWDHRLQQIFTHF